MNGKLILVIVLTVLVTIVMIQNMNVVSFRLLFWQLEVSQLLLVLIMLGSGFIVGFTIAKLSGRKTDPT